MRCRSIRFKSWVGVTTATLAILAQALAPAASSATTSFAFGRLAGTDRYDTAARAAVAAFPGGTSEVLVANGSLAHFPDALASSYLAGYARAAILLTDATTLPAPTDQALRTLGAKNVVIVGGTSSVSDQVSAQLAQEGYMVSRVSGPTRYDTAAALAALPPASHIGNGPSGVPTAVVASGANFPDALVSGPMGYASDFPVEITDSANLSPQTRQSLQALGIKSVLIAGGTAAVSAAVEGQIQGLGITTRRFSGSDRTDTAAQVARFEVSSLGYSPATVDLARGDDPADSMAGAPYGGSTMTPLLLTANSNVLGTASAAYLSSNVATLASGQIFGGTGAVSQQVQDQANSDARGGLNQVSLAANPASIRANGADTSTITATVNDSAGSPDGGTNVTFSPASNPSGACGALSSATAATGSKGTATVTYTASSTPGTCTITAIESQTGASSTVSITQVGPVFLASSETNGGTLVTLTYSEPITCSSVDPVGSDYTITVTNGGGSPGAGANCSGQSTATVTLNVSPSHFTSGQVVTVTARQGADGNTVLDARGNAQPVGDATTHTVG